MEYIFITLGLWSALILFWLVAGKVDSKSTLQSETFSFVKLIGSSLIVYLPLFFGGLFASKLYDNSSLLGIVGILVVAVGVYFAIWARLTLGTNWSGKIMIQKEHRLITVGPYSLTRHPIYFGGLLAILGSCLVLGQVFGFICLILFVFGLVVKSKQEEELLKKQFPNQYSSYSRKVKMLIPWLY